MLQKNGHIPSDPTLFKSYAEYGHFVDVRVAALAAVVDYTRGTHSHRNHTHTQSQSMSVRATEDQAHAFDIIWLFENHCEVRLA